MTQKHATSLFILLVVFTIAISGFAFFSLQLSQQDTPTELSKNSSIQPQVINSDIDTSDWNTYRNEELGFEVKYPKTWRVENGKFYDTEETRYFEGSETYVVSVSVFELEKELTFKEWSNQWGNSRIKNSGSVDKIIFNKITAIKGTDYLGTQTVFSHKNNIYSVNQINLGSEEFNLEIEQKYNAMLSSWTFIK